MTNEKDIDRLAREGDVLAAEAIIMQRDELLDAMKKIAAIEYNENGGDWDEIDEAQDIARDAIAKVEKAK